MDMYLLGNLVVCLATILQAASGLGFAMVAVPLLAMIDLGFVPGPQLLAMLFLSLAMSGNGRKDIDRPGLRTMLMPLAAGTIAGAAILAQMDTGAISLTFSILVLTTVAATTFGLNVKRSRGALIAGGAAAGLMGTISGMHGPPLAILYSRASPATGRSTIATVCVFAVVLSLLSLHFAGLFGLREIGLGISLLPGVAVGYIIYAAVGERLLSATVSRHLMLAVSALGAAALMVRILLA